MNRDLYLSDLLKQFIADCLEEAAIYHYADPIASLTGSLNAAIRGDMIMFVGGGDVGIEQVQFILDVSGQTRRLGDCDSRSARSSAG